MIPSFLKHIGKYHKVFFIVLFLFVCFLIFWPLFFGKVITDDFTLFHQYPSLAFFESFLRGENKISLWSPLYLSGFPIYVGQFFIIIPILFLKFLDYLSVHAILTFLSFFLALIVSYILGRALKLSKEASLIMAFTYVFSQLFMYLGSLLVFSFLFSVLPFLFLVVLRASQSKRFLIIPGIGLIGLSWYSAFSEFLVFSLGAILFFGFYLDLINYRLNGNLPFIKRFKGTFGAFALIAGGMIIGLPRIIAIADFINISARAFGAMGTTSFLNIGDFLNYFFPYFRLRDYGVVPFYQNGALNIYVGFLPMALGIIAIMKSRTLFLRFRWVFCFIILFLIPFLTLIQFTHFFDIIYKLTRGKIGGAWKILFIGNFSLAILAGAGLDYLTRLGIPPFFKKASFWVKGFLFLFITVIAGSMVVFLFYGNFVLSVLKSFFNSRVYHSNFSQPLDHYYKMIESAFADAKSMFSFSNYHFVISVLFIVVPSICLILFFKGKINNNLFKKIMAFSVVANTILIWQGYYSLASKDFVTMPPKTAIYLKQKVNVPFRIFRFWPGLADYGVYGLDAHDSESKLELLKELLTPNLNMLYGIESAEGDENFMAYRQSRLLGFLGSFRSPQNDDKNWSKQKSSLENKLSVFQSSKLRGLLSMMNVKYVLTSFNFTPPFKKVFTAYTSDNIPVFIYENLDVLPRIYFADNVKFVASDADNSFNALINNYDFRKITLIECSLQDCSGANQPSKSDSIEIKETQSGYLRLTVVNKNPRWLIRTESNLPYWEVSINGTLSKIFTANYLYQAIYLSPGQNNVVFHYPGILGQAKYSLRHILKSL